MSTLTPDHEFEDRIASRLLDVLIRAALIGVLAALCYVVFAPFLTLMAWAVILAISLYPLHRALARRVGGRQGVAATILVIAASVLIIVPTAILADSFGSSTQAFITAVQENTLKIPPPRPGVRDWPLVGEKIHGVWAKAHSVASIIAPRWATRARARAGTSSSA